MTTKFGTVFLGDTRQRVLSNSTPPSSPPPPHSDTIDDVLDDSRPAAPTGAAVNVTVPGPPPPPPAKIDPELSLELRLRWLEALLFGVPGAEDPKGKGKSDLKRGETLSRRAEALQRRLDAIVEGNDGLKRFVSTYEQHAQYLTPAFALSGTVPSATPTAYENMSSIELDALLTEMAPEIRAADRDMAEIEALEHKGVTGAGSLADHETLKPRLDALLKAHEEDLKLATALERRVATLVERHATHVDALSELFVDWDDTLAVVEDKTMKLEKQREDRRRLGFE